MNIKHKLSLVLAITIGFACLFTIVFKQTANAQLSFNPTPSSHMPTPMLEHLYWCNTYPRGPAFVNWTTDGSNNATNYFSVPYGYTGPLYIRLHSAGSVCHSNNNVWYSQFYVWNVTASSGSASAGPRHNYLDFTAGPSTPGTYSEWFSNVYWDPGGAMTTDRTVDLNIDLRGMSYTNAGSYNCILGPAGNMGNWNHWACNAQNIPIRIEIDVAPPPPPVDVCDNLPGNQATVPSGYIRVGNSCYRRQASCSFINTPTSAYIGAGFTVQVRIANHSSSNQNITGNVVISGSGATASGLTSPRTGHSVSPGNSLDLSANTVTATGPGTYTITARIANTTNNASCSTAITIRYIRPSVVCTITDLAFSEINQEDVGFRLTATYDSPSNGASGVSAPNGASVTAASATFNGANASRLPDPLPTNMTRGSPATISFTYDAPNTANTYEVNGSVTLNVPDGIGGNYPVTATCRENTRVGNLPYFKAYGGDIFSGGGFDNETAAEGCSPPAAESGGVYAFANQVAPNQFRGASAQFNINALMNVRGTYSASQRAAPAVANTYPAAGLTIANTSGVGGEAMGGNSGDSRCLIDYFTTTRDASLNQGTLNGGNVPANRDRIQYFGLASGNILNPTQINHGTQVGVFVDGDVFINGNITYANGSRVDVTDLPNFVLIVRGDIKIGRTVTELNGTYVAQPRNNGTGGRIFTCAPSASGTYGASNIYQECQTPLTVYGSLVAKTIRFGRMNGTVGSAAPGEYPPSSNIAETIILTPESYLAPSPLRDPTQPEGSTSTDRWDAASILPPVF